jgi:hypothetical protein
MKIIVTESIAKEGIEQLQNDGFEVDVRFGISAEELLDIIQDYDAIIVRSVTQVNKQLMDKGSKLKVVGRAGNGVDNIDLQTATDKGIIVVNTPESNSMAAAELAVLLLCGSHCPLCHPVRLHRHHHCAAGVAEPQLRDPDSWGGIERGPGGSSERTITGGRVMPVRLFVNVF